MASGNKQKPQPELIRQIVERSRKPLVFRGLLTTKSWPMMNFTPSDWAKLFNGRILECRVGLRGSSEEEDEEEEPQWEGRCGSVKCSYSELVKWAQGDKVEGELELLDPSKHFLYFGYQYMKDVFQEDVLSMTEWAELGYAGRNGTDSTFWLGTVGAHTPCHYDTYGCNLVAQVSGRKRWILFPPEDTPFLQATRVPYEESSVYSRINFERVGPLRVEGTHPHVVVLEPGDVLLVPRHWWHHVTNLELSVSVNIWLERPEDEEARLQEALVKFLMAHVSRNLPEESVMELLNPNEVATADADLDEIQSFISLSVTRLKDRSVSSPEIAELELPSEPWIVPVRSQTGPHERQITEEPQQSDGEFNTLDVMRAFCHPEVIQVVSRLLLKK